MDERVTRTRGLAAERGFEQSSSEEVGRLLAVLAAAVPRGGRILELGTGLGVGTAWLVAGLEHRDDVGLISVEADPALSAAAAQVGWPSWVRFVVGDPLDALPGLGAFDLVFANAVAGKWYGLEATLAALRVGGQLVVDDMTPQNRAGAEHRHPIFEVRESLLSHPELRAVELAFETGVILATRIPSPLAAPGPGGVRTAVVADAPSLAGLVAQLGGRAEAGSLARGLESVEADPGSRIFVAEVDGVVVGYAYVHLVANLDRPGSWARLASMVVDPSHRRRGLGRSLVRAVEDFARSEGAETMELASGPQRTEALSFYESLGYAPTANSLWYAKSLAR